MILALLLVPALGGGLAFFLRSHPWRRALLVAVAELHCVLMGWVWVHPQGAGAWLALDEAGLLFLSITSVLFLAAAVYAAGYLSRESRAEQPDFEEGLLFVNQPEAVFTGCMLLFLATMTLVCLSRHLGLQWVAIEATTLCSAPLIYFHRQHRSLEAAWKYLLICSVGIALALLGNFFLVVAFSPPGSGQSASLHLTALLQAGVSPQLVWLKVAFVFLLVGYGTKMGLAPLHTWLPDAHSEAPSVVSALLSGALLNCAFLGILRVWQVLVHAGQASFAQPLLVGFGLVSMAVGAVFILGQADFKRMLAYSSVENMGILALGLGLGGAAVFGALLHAVNHSLTKAMLFLAAGNILAAYRTKSCGQVRGLLRVLPVTGALWIAGFLAITGSPPFGTFLSKFTVIKGAFDAGHPWVGGAALTILAVLFVGMTVIVLRMAQGAAPEPAVDGPGETWWSVLPPLVLAAAVLALGLYLPPCLERVLTDAARAFGGGGL